MHRIAISLLLASMLNGCAGYKTKDIFAQSRDWFGKTNHQLDNLSSPANKVNYDSEVQALFAQPYIDPLTDYLNEHIDDKSRAEPLRRISEERKVRCQQIADKYATRPLTQESLNLYQAGYNYSCPKDVEAFALKLAAAEEAKQSQAVASAGQSPVKITLLDEAIVSNVNKEQLNDCYLLTTISNFREAKQACLLPAKGGDVRSQLNMAIIHKALEEYPQTVEWAEKVEAKSPRARFLMGELYASGLGVEQNAIAAFDWFKKAGEDGYADGQYMTAWSYEAGIGTSQNIEQAITWYQRAALNNNVQAKHALGALLIQQRKNSSTVEDGRNWLIQAARAGYADSALLLGKLLQPTEPAKALVWYEVAQQQESVEAGELADKLRPRIHPEVLNSARLQIHRLLESEN